MTNGSLNLSLRHQKQKQDDRDVSEENIGKKILPDLRGKFNYNRMNQTVFMY